MKTAALPILLLDVDGVIAPFSGEYGHRPVDLGALGVLYLDEPAVSARLTALHDAFEIVWCTARETDAVTVIGPRHGLPADLAHVHFGTTREPGQQITVPPTRPAGPGSCPL